MNGPEGVKYNSKNASVIEVKEEEEDDEFKNGNTPQGKTP